MVTGSSSSGTMVTCALELERAVETPVFLFLWPGALRRRHFPASRCRARRRGGEEELPLGAAAGSQAQQPTTPRRTPQDSSPSSGPGPSVASCFGNLRCLVTVLTTVYCVHSAVPLPATPSPVTAPTVTVLGMRTCRLSEGKQGGEVVRPRLSRW